VRGEGRLSCAVATAAKEEVDSPHAVRALRGLRRENGPRSSAALAPLERRTDPRILVGREHSTMPGVFQLSPELALVQTLIFFARSSTIPTISAGCRHQRASDVFAWAASRSPR